MRRSETKCPARLWSGTGFPLSSGPCPGVVRARDRARNRLRPDLVQLEERRLLSTFAVNSTADDGSHGTLRWAVAQANVASSPSQIEINLGTSAAAIILSQGQLELSDTSASIAIYDGSGQGPVTISGNGASRVIQIDSQVTATITGLTIASGSANGNGGGVYNAGAPPWIWKDCTIESSSATGMGGGLGQQWHGDKLTGLHDQWQYVARLRRRRRKQPLFRSKSRRNDAEQLYDLGQLQPQRQRRAEQ